MRSFCRKNNVRKIPLFGGGGFGGGGGSADFIFMGARIFLTNACFSRILSTLTEVLGRDIRANDPGCPWDIRPENFLFGLIFRS